ncbi:hypothetical protein XENOCAPTIV_000189 [Xenoophorus captivus]|uniref:Uncharacterized protein n=1 Tax=Xenoophorus captivus TaxID=1517983 RepID=A0ABV0RBS0_9TELE
MLTQTLYSLKALITQQDSRIELQRVFQSKSKLPVRSNSSVLLEQEKHRNLEKQREELAKLHKQQVQHQAEQQRWEKEKEKQRMLIEGQEAELQQRQEECRKREAALKEENLELKMLRETYQQDLERLRETTRKLDREKEQVNREKERLEKMKSKLIPNYDDPTRVRRENLVSTTVNGGGTLTQPSNPLVFTGNFPDPADSPPRVPPRRESISPRPNKQRLPVQLISTTNEVQKPAEVQQKIPRKLAAEAKGKGKTLKAKHSHKRAHSAGQKPGNNLLCCVLNVYECLNLINYQIHFLYRGSYWPISCKHMLSVSFWYLFFPPANIDVSQVVPIRTVHAVLTWDILASNKPVRVYNDAGSDW